jgi:hypothetical protein
MNEQKEKQNVKPNKGKNLEMDVNGEIYLRLPIRTGIITENDNILDLVDKYVAPNLLKGDLIFISEKIVALTQRRIVDFKDIKTTPIARFLSKHIHNHYGTKDFRGFGHGTPMAMQLFIEEAGLLRVLFAAGVAAITRPLGIKGLFYIICGKKAKSIDCPMSFLIQPYTHYAKLSPINPSGVAKDIKKKNGNDVVIVDANYLGAFSLGKSNKNIKEKFIQDVFRDNPAGQGDEMTPFFIVRKNLLLDEN